MISHTRVGVCLHHCLHGTLLASRLGQKLWSHFEVSDQHFYLIGQAVFVVLDYVSELMLTETVLVGGQQQDLIICIPMST